MAQSIGQASQSNRLAVEATVAAFNSFTRTGAAFSANVTQNPSWFCGDNYTELWSHLPRPLVFLNTEEGIPVTRDLEEAFYISKELNLITRDPDVRTKLLKGWDLEKLRFARALCLRPELISALSHEDGTTLPITTQYDMPPIDLRAWLQHYEGSISILRFLLEGEESTYSALDQTLILNLFSIVGTNVYGLSGLLEMPPVEKAIAAAEQDPQMDRRFVDPEFLLMLSKLRQSKSV